MPDEWIRQWGDPVLREVAAPVRGVDDILRARVDRMKRRLKDAEGAGLAGTQVGFLRRVFVFRFSVEEEIETLINPEVVAASNEQACFIEGCLSFQAVVVKVNRPIAIRVRAQTLGGRSRVLEVDGYRASLIQHEIDHLDGVLTLDRADPAERRRAVGLLLDRARVEGEAIALAC